MRGMVLIMRGMVLTRGEDPAGRLRCLAGGPVIRVRVRVRPAYEG